MASNKQISDEFQVLTTLESVKENPDMWGADNNISSIPTWIYRDDDAASFNYAEISYNPLWLKLFDELIVNSIDQLTRFPKLVKNIIVEFDRKTGKISIYNDGPTIPVIVHEEYKKYIPQIIFGEFLAGNNFRDKKTGKRRNETTGGKNGVGAKLSNCFSTKFTIECNDNVRKVYYRQSWADRMNICNEPNIQSWKDLPTEYKTAFTRIAYKPDYKELGYSKYSTAIFEVLNPILYTRCMFASIYCSGSVSIKYNNKIIPICNLLDLSRHIPEYSNVDESDVIKFELKSKNMPNWEVIMIISDHDNKYKSIGLVNGVCSHTGTHIDYIINTLTAKYKDKIKAAYKIQTWNKRILDRFMFVMVKAEVNNPRFEGQAKDQLKFPTDFSSYVIPAAIYKKFYEYITSYLDLLYLEKSQDTEKKQTRKRIIVKKYEAAEKAGTRESHKCSLFIPEGDSPEGFVRWGITEKTTKLGGFKYYGIFNIQGKPMNARKESKLVTHKDKQIRIRSDKLKANERWAALVEVLGLDYTATYETDKEFKKLRYGTVIVTVDQDVDGVGHIFGLILNFFHLFWPALINRGYIKRLATPIIRAFPQKKSAKVISFYSDDEFTKWAHEKFDGLVVSNYTIKYFKGLAAHNKQSAIDIFRRFNERLYTYTLDDLTDLLMESYFGKDTAARKEELRQPVVPYQPTNENKITCTQQLRYETKEYDLEDIKRSLPHIIDGLRPAARTVVAGARMIFKDNETIKVYQITGDLTKRLHYQHGEKSLNDTIIRLAQSFPGARNLPFIYGDAMFGSRARGGKDAGAPRYISANLNRRLTNSIFPPVDDFLLEYNYDDGVMCEPKYYVPVVPTAIMESYQTPATGWATKIWARDYKQVINNIRRKIAGGDIEKMYYWDRCNCTIYEEDDKIIMVGHTEIDDDNNVYITEMPPGVWSAEWKAKFIEDPNVDYIMDNSTDTEIDITIKLIPSHTIEESGKGNPIMDVYTEYFKNYISVNSNLNFLSKDGLINEVSSYEEAFNIWYEERKKLYQTRIERRTIQLKWLIIMYENLIRYADNYVEYKISGKSSANVDKILEQNNYVRLNHTHLNNPKYVKVEKLVDHFNENATYNYLVNLRDSDRFDIPNANRRRELEKLKNELDELTIQDTYFIGARIWLKELDCVESCIDAGLSLGWDYGEYKVNYG